MPGISPPPPGAATRHGAIVRLEPGMLVVEKGFFFPKDYAIPEHRQIDVPVMKEEVHVERVPASAAGAPAGEAFREETLRVPVREEEVEITKKPRVREEVRVSRTARQQEQRVEGDVRHEEARIERSDEPGRVTDAGEEPPGGIRGDEP